MGKILTQIWKNHFAEVGEPIGSPSTERQTTKHVRLTHLSLGNAQGSWSLSEQDLGIEEWMMDFSKTADHT